MSDTNPKFDLRNDCPADPSKPEPVGTSLVESIQSERLTDALASITDIGLEAVSESKIPGVSTLVGIYRAQKQVRQNLEIRNIIRFLQEIENVSPEKRREFAEKQKSDGKIAQFGENIVLILSQIDDTAKAGMIGRVMAAHIEGHINFEKAMRVIAILNRCYSQDLDYLKNFKTGVQRSGTDIAVALFSAGLLADCGFDGGSFSDPESSGTVYDLNEYGRLVRKYAL